ncbi:MAG: isopenicillin N synthase family dioxygenase [Acidimicrobiales bacterium]
MSIPTIDLTRPRSEVAADIDLACREVGFFAIVGHNVPISVTRRAWATTDAFFDLPLDLKMTARHPTEKHHPYGYFPSGQEALAASLGVVTPPDLKESFNIAPPPDHADGTGRFGGVGRIWPQQPPGLRMAWIDYYESMVALAEQLLEFMAEALGMDRTHFASSVDQHLSALRGLNYPPLNHGPASGQLRAGEHTDYGTLTILLPGTGSGGLEVLRRNDEWEQVQPVTDGFVVNIGDMMAQWTNDLWRSTKHRVAVPDSEVAANERRQALAFFHQPNWDAEISPLPTCVPPGQAPKYEPVLAGPWLRAKFDAASTGG